MSEWFSKIEGLIGLKKLLKNYNLIKHLKNQGIDLNKMISLSEKAIKDVYSSTEGFTEIARTEMNSGICTVYSNRTSKLLMVVDDPVSRETYYLGPFSKLNLQAILITLKDVNEGV